MIFYIRKRFLQSKWLKKYLDLIMDYYGFDVE